ncbi:MAG: dihydroorotase [Oscillospiraceae bacterium]|nr:dihydroorotase [Oscillospiraceae bacterium]
MLIKNGIIYTGSGFEKQNIRCCGAVIAEIGQTITADDNECIDAEGLVVSPGFVDMHVHLREPGYTQKETIATGTAAAIAGGFTTICAMPNVTPTPDTLQNLLVQQAIINAEGRCHVRPFMTITRDRAGNTPTDLSDFPAFCAGISDDGNGVQSMAVMELAIKQAAQSDVLVCAHCEDASISPAGGCVHNGDYAKQNNLIGIPSASEAAMVARDLKLVAQYRCRYHVCHVSANESIDQIATAKRRGLPVSCEVTPHHALLCVDDIADNGDFKMSPPLRDASDRQALVQGIIDGTVDAIATDHAPHTSQEKAGGLAKSAMGVVGLETAFAVLYTGLVNTQIISFEKLLSLLTFGPSQIINQPCGIKVGNQADLILINPKESWVVDSSKFFSKGRASPFNGKKVVGRVIATIFNGRVVFEAKPGISAH